LRCNLPGLGQQQANAEWLDRARNVWRGQRPGGQGGGAKQSLAARDKQAGRFLYHSVPPAVFSY
jgi:hypothetical protein